jgi:hypothetical protein
MFFLMGPLVVYLTLMKWLWDPHVKKPKKNIVRIGVHNIVKQMGKNNLENQTKPVTFENWLTMTLN